VINRPFVLCLTLAAAGLSGCGGGGASADAVQDAVRALPYDVQFRDVDRPDGVELLVAGRMRDERTGTAIDFAAQQGGTADTTPLVPDATQDSTSSCAGITVWTTPDEGDDAERARILTMQGALERAVWGVVDDAECHG